MSMGLPYTIREVVPYQNADALDHVSVTTDTVAEAWISSAKKYFCTPEFAQISTVQESGIMRLI